MRENCCWKFEILHMRWIRLCKRRDSRETRRRFVRFHDKKPYAQSRSFSFRSDIRHRFEGARPRSGNAGCSSPDRTERSFAEEDLADRAASSISEVAPGLEARAGRTMKSHTEVGWWRWAAAAVDQEPEEEKWPVLVWEIESVLVAANKKMDWILKAEVPVDKVDMAVKAEAQYLKICQWMNQTTI